MKRRHVIHLLSSGVAAGAVGFSQATPAHAQSLWGMMNQGRTLTDAEREANSALAIQAIDSVEPILSYDTANNLKLAIAQYEPFVLAGGWEEVPPYSFCTFDGETAMVEDFLPCRLAAAA